MAGDAAEHPAGAMKMASDIPIIPTFAPIQITPQMVNLLFLGIVFAVLFAIIYRLARNRIYVEIYESVKGGYVVNPGRFRIVFDKKTDMHSLVSMSGKERLPAFSSADYQKVDGCSFIGITRQIKLLKINKHTYYVLRPSDGISQIGDVHPYNSMTWIYAQVNKEVDDLIKRGGFKNFLTYAAPTMVIVICIVILVSAIWTDRLLLESLGAQVEKVGTALAEVCKTWIE